MRVLVTGAAGFIGFHTSRTLLERGDEVIGYDNFNPYYDPELKEKRAALLAELPGFQMVRGDLNDAATLDAAFDALGAGDETRVCHLAAQAGVRYSIEHPERYLRDNVDGFHQVLSRCQRRGVGGLIFASTSSVYGNNRSELLSESCNTDRQASVYGMTKKANELEASVYHSLYGLKATGLRFFTAYGPWGRPDMALFLFTDAILNDRPIKVFGQGDMRRDFTFIDDIVAGVVAALDRNLEFEILNLGRGKPEELLEFIRQIEETLGLEARKEMLPMQPGDVRQTHADVSRARELLGYSPSVTIAEGIPRFVSWYRQYYRI
ncbi:MAG TPA: NAD-dependent epimerase/dehydratase family protein [Thermoanaerobaculia bacterium]|nr:NAD-dependent epimerase/dehydratase family protein [Thermoanaerobaculia bacterium]